VTRFHAILPYAPFFAALGRVEGNEPPLQEAEPELQFREVQMDSIDDFKLLARWEADASIRHLALPHRDEKSLVSCRSAEKIQKDSANEGPFRPVENLMILRDGRPIGHCTLLIDPPHRLTKEGKVAWPSITIGEENFRAKGFGQTIGKHLESLARKHGAGVIEVGIFEFNEPAQKLCLSMGYERFGQMDRCTYWQGRYWADLRFRKKLS
jgi:RimJ/RimL family protein N-acetyltransferase